MDYLSWWCLSSLFSRHLDHPCLHIVPSLELAQKISVQPCSETDQELI